MNDKEEINEHSPQTPAQSIGESWNERMRMIRLRRKKEASLSRRVPHRSALAENPLCRSVPDRGGYCHYRYEVLAGKFGRTIFMTMPPPHRWPSSDHHRESTILSIFILPGLCESRRQAPRHEPDSLDTVVVVLSPGSLFIGLIIYLLIREPLPTLVRAAAIGRPALQFLPQLQMRPASQLSQLQA